MFERESPDPDSAGLLPGPPEFRGPPRELEQTVNAMLKIIKGAFPGLFPDKRKRDGIVKSVIMDALRARLAQYTTSAQQDEEFLASRDVTGRLRMAIEVRLGEKALLREAISHLGRPASPDEQGDASGPKKKKM